MLNVNTISISYINASSVLFDEYLGDFRHNRAAKKFLEPNNLKGKTMKTLTIISIALFSLANVADAGISRFDAFKKNCNAMGGKFGERWLKLNETYGCHSEVIKVDEGMHVTVDQVLASLKNQKNQC